MYGNRSPARVPLENRSRQELDDQKWIDDFAAVGLVDPDAHPNVKRKRNKNVVFQESSTTLPA